MVVVLEVAVDAEARAQGRGEEAAAGGGAHEGEGAERELHATGAGALVDHDVDAVVFHRRVEVFFDHAAEAVYLVDKQDVVFFERGEYAGQVAGLVEDGTRGDLEAHAELVGDDTGQGGFAEAGRAVEQQVVEGLVAHARCGDEYPEVVDDFFLAVECLEASGAQGALEVSVGVGLVVAYVEIVHSFLWGIIGVFPLSF